MIMKLLAKNKIGKYKWRSCGFSEQDLRSLRPLRNSTEEFEGRLVIGLPLQEGK